jgi:arylsulfotransferase ASST
MRKLPIFLSLALTFFFPLTLLAFPSVFPHGTTIYNPDKCQSGYTVFGTEVEGEGAVLIDMNGNVVHQWKEMSNREHPVKILEGGYIMGATRENTEHVGRLWKHAESTDLSIMDWDGNIVWSVAKAGMHHDFQIAGNPVGYWVPGLPLKMNKGNVLILSHKIATNENITPKELYDDYIAEVDHNGKVVWDYLCSDYFDEIPFSEAAKKTLWKYPTYSMTRTKGIKGGDWIHINSASYVGPNKWYDEDPVKYAAFHPENIIMCGRQTNTISIIEKKTKKRVWLVGPDYSKKTKWTFAGKTYKRAYKKLGQIIGQHHAHIIPKGLPGEGNMLIFDNGGAAGYGAPNPGAHVGWSDARRDSSRVIEINPITLKIVWEYSAKKVGYRDQTRFYASYVSSAQRLPNGNTMITSGATGRLIEVTPENEIVWEYISPYYNENGKYNLVYRAYRVPYDWIPQLKKPSEKAVDPGDITKLRVGNLNVAK